MIMTAELSPQAEAEICARLEMSGLSPEGIAELLGCTASEVRHRLNLHEFLDVYREERRRFLP
jgi:DNA-directed RNA polymerase specialized sigma24 family protein